MSRVSWRKVLTITSGQTTSDSLITPTGVSSIIDLTVYGPSALTGTVTVQVAPTDAPQSGDWVPLTKSGSNVTIAAAVATPIAGLFRALRLVSGSAEASTRTFPILGQGEI
jgi:hypothetical protein